MLKTDVKWSSSRRYKSRSEWEPLGFFSEALCNATSFDIMLGFFSSSAINVLSDGFAAFLYNGGRMRMVINDVLSEADRNVMVVAEKDEDTPFFDLYSIDRISRTLSKRDVHFFECLAWLIRHERIEIKIITPKGNGIAHTKCGVFSDGLNKVAFEGSCNFSRMALVENIEGINAFCDWDGEPACNTISEIQEDFDKTFLGHNESVIYLSPENVKTYLTTNYKEKDIKELLDDEKRLMEEGIEEYEAIESVKKVLERAKNKVQSIIEDQEEKKASLDVLLEAPKFPYPSGPREYQQLAFNNWKNNGQQGLFAMATGTGKTITSLNCLLEIYKRLNYYKAIILVPTITLVNQWEEECRKFKFRNIVKVCSKNPHWREQVEAIEYKEKLDITGKKQSYIIISTYASYGRQNISERLDVFPKKKLLLIADEAHNMGSGTISKKMNSIPYVRRIGLSATPERQYDDEGNEKLMNFFGCAEGQFTFEYSMEEAIQKGVLCRYKYFPHVVRLTSSEMEQYLAISKKLAVYYTKADKFRPKDDPILTALLLKRKRIIHKAANKEEVFREILKQRLEKNGDLKYTLVYVPEGNKPDEDADVYDQSDVISSTADDEHLIERYTSIVSDMSPSTTVRKFTSNTTERDSMLRDFANGTLEVLTSMKCLDEGVDVPRSELAIFCASTGNPRQFIQRRGRILRTHPDKHMAEIHDLVVAPEVSDGEDTYNMERNLLATELKRVHNFACLSENMDYTIKELEDILNYYKLSIFNS